MTTDTRDLTATVLTPQQWRARQEHHRATVDKLTAGRRERRSRGERHPVWDFMYTYYPRFENPTWGIFVVAGQSAPASLASRVEMGVSRVSYGMDAG
ncbi:MAG: hypothetical protein ACTH2Y_00005 [Corynebacterium sp.]|uniref:hypothetical protein n=1 Tax=Corynebacterium sp. TaxID=1720 RepID=UPI003F90269A